MTNAASTLRSTRSVFQGRSPVDMRSVAFVAYSGVLVALIAVTPLVRALMLALTRPATLSALDSPGAEPVVGLLLGACLALLPAVGGVFGPAFLRHPFLAHVLMRWDLSRDTVLARPVLLSVAALSALAAFACALLSGALVLAGRSEIGQAAAFMSGAVCLSVTGAVVWLAGQRLGRRGAWAGSVILIGTVVWTAAFPEARALTPWGWVASLYPGAAAGSAGQLPTIAVFAGVSAVALPFLMRSMPGQEVVDQAIRWNTAVTTARGGDPTASVATFRALPRSGRSWVAVPHASVPLWLFLRRDLVGACRTPVRFATAITGLVCAGVLASPIGLPPSSVMVANGAAVIIGFVSLRSAHRRRPARSRSLRRFSALRLFAVAPGETSYPATPDCFCARDGRRIRADSARLSDGSRARALERGTCGAPARLRRRKGSSLALPAESHSDAVWRSLRTRHPRLAP